MRFHRSFDLSVYFIADPTLCAGRDIIDVTAAAIKGGATMIQLRNKQDRISTIEKQARALLELTRATKIRLLINDYMDVAFNTGADGVHLGQGDAPVADARKVLGPDAIIGLTAFTEAHINALNADEVDYIGTGPFYPTQTDKGKSVLGAEGFAPLVAMSPVPVVGIGGITAENAPAVIQAGAAGVAVMRGISYADDVEAAARAVAAAVSGARLKAAS